MQSSKVKNLRVLQHLQKWSALDESSSTHGFYNAFVANFSPKFSRIIRPGSKHPRSEQDARLAKFRRSDEEDTTKSLSSQL